MDRSGQSDVELMLAVKAGEDAAFDVLVQRYGDRMLNYLFRYTGQREEAEDLAQQVFWRLYRSAPRYEPTAKFTTFLYTIATNVARSAHDRLVKKAVHQSWDQPLGAAGQSLSERVASRRPSPWRQVLSEQRLTVIHQALNRLPEELRQVFLLSEDEGLSYAEIAAIMNIPVGTVGSRKNHAVKQLREALSPLREELMGEHS